MSDQWRTAAAAEGESLQAPSNTESPGSTAALQKFLAQKDRFSSRDWKLVGTTAVVVLLLVLGVGKIGGLFSGSSISGQSFTQITSGTVALDEGELKDAVKTLGIAVYWTGPMDGAKYTLDSRTNGQTFVRYLPKGEGVEDTAPNYRVVGTYTMTDAFASTQDAGLLSGGVGFTNSDGAAVYYNKATPTNVYIAFQGKDVQVEIYDPNNGQAIQLATTPNTVQLVI